MMYINDPRDYHINQITTLGWELTVCNMLYPEDSPCREVIYKNASYGILLHDYLAQYVNMHTIQHLMEVGGGYGYLMKDFLSCLGNVQVTMVDISPAMLTEQKKNIKGNVRFIQSDFLELDDSLLQGINLILCNEIVGDFITLCNIDKEILKNSQQKEIRECARLIHEYNLDIPSTPFNFNLGALLALEKMCRAGINVIYVSEHSCESESGGEFKSCVAITPTYTPYEITLYGHSEYTIKFSHLEAIAHRWGYKVYRGVYNDIFQCRMTPKVQFILHSTVNAKDEHEIIRQFIGDMFMYEYIMCIR